MLERDEYLQAHPSIQALQSGAHTALELSQFVVCLLALTEKPESYLTESCHPTSFKLSEKALFRLAEEEPVCKCVCGYALVDFSCDWKHWHSAEYNRKHK